MKKYISYALILIAIITVVVWAISQYIQPILPNNLNGGLILFFAALLSVMAVIANFKDIIELFRLLFGADNKKINDINNNPEQNSERTYINHAEQVTIQSITSNTNPEKSNLCLRIKHNLPQPNYGEFIGRELELGRIVSILRPYPHSQYPLVTIDGIGGIGKTALALEIAHRYLNNFMNITDSELFEAIIWTSAKRTNLTSEGIITRQPTQSTLEDIFRTIAITLQIQDKFNAFAEQRSYIISQALANQRTLLIVDNLETVDDESVISFLRELPAPTKAIITTRHRLDVAYAVRLTGMPIYDGLALISQECKKKSVSLKDSDINQLFNRTGGVPLAIVWCIGKMGLGYEIDTILLDLGNANGDITRFCFEKSINAIRGTNSHKLLLSFVFFDGNVTREMLGLISNLSSLDRDESLAKLEQLSLINKNNDCFYLLPLTKIYIESELELFPEINAKLNFSWLRNFANATLSQIAPPSNEWWTFCSKNGLSIPIGLIRHGEKQILEINEFSVHILIGGITGSGKSILLRTIIFNLALQYSPKEVELYLIDSKGAEFSIFDTNNLPHAKEIINGCYDYEHLHILKKIHSEIIQRLDSFKLIGVTSYEEFRKRNVTKPLPRIVLIMDEIPFRFSDNSNDGEGLQFLLADILRTGRVAGVNVILCGQHFGSIQNVLSNFSTRIILRTTDDPSRILLNDSVYASRWLTRAGEAIYYETSWNKEHYKLLQVANVTDDEAEIYLDKLSELTHKNFNNSSTLSKE